MSSLSFGIQSWLAFFIVYELSSRTEGKTKREVFNTSADQGRCRELEAMAGSEQ